MLVTSKAASMILSHGLESWKEGEDRQASLMWEIQYPLHFHSHDRASAALLDSWDRWITPPKTMHAETRDSHRADNTGSSLNPKPCALSSLSSLNLELCA